MFKGFSSAKRPKNNEPLNWEELFAEPSTEGYLASMAPRSQADDNRPAQRSDHNSEPEQSLLIVPPSAATRDRHNDAGPLKSPVHDNGAQQQTAATEPTPYHTTARSAFGTLSVDTGRHAGANSAASSPSVSTDSGIHDHHEVRAGLPPTSAPRVSFGTLPAALGGRTLPAPSFGTLPAALGSGGTAPAKLAPQFAPFSSFGTLPAALGGRTSPAPSFGTLPAALGGGGTAPAKLEPQAPPAPSFGTLPAALGGGGTAPAKVAPQDPHVTSFGTLPAALGGGGTPSPAKFFAKSPGGGGFHGFGACTKPVSFPSSLATPVTASKSPTTTSPEASGAARIFQAAMGASERATRRDASASPETAFANLKISAEGSVATSSTASSTGGGFTGFQKPATPSSSAGFNANAASFATSTMSKPSGFSGFTCFKNAPTAPRTTPPATDAVTFGTLKSAPTVPAGTTTTPPGTIPDDPSTGRVQMNFGTLHVSGPTATMNVLAARAKEEKEEKMMEMERALAQQHQQQEEAKKRVRFEDVKEVLAVKKDVQQGADSDDETETEDEAAQPAPRPWGKRPCFRKMLGGGNKKLVLSNPPKGVVDYFVGHVHRSYGCCYDNLSNTFFATSPGDRGRSNGQVVALSGDCVKPGFIVAGNLLEPAAIAVYEPGLSVCVVTNRGIFVLTRRNDEQGEMVSFLARQISRQGFHRGICTTAGGGIVSFSNGRIRLFDGSVANGDEKVLAETNYDRIINETLFQDLKLASRRSEKSNCCFMDIVENRLAMSDLQKHVISLWQIDESPGSGVSIKFVRAIDVATCANPTKRPYGSTVAVPLGKCAYASGIRLDVEGWVLCADADGRTIQIYDNELKFVTRLEAPGRLPYISGLYIEAGGHLMVCDRKSEVGGLRVYMLESQEASGDDEKKKQSSSGALGFAAAARLQQGGRF